jgi:branched-subunit amino acid transport protein
MTGLVAMLALAAICWMFRALFIVFIPAERLPARFREALEHLAPAVLAALVAVETVETTRDTAPMATVLLLTALALVALVVRVTGSLLLSMGLALGAALAIDLIVLA